VAAARSAAAANSATAAARWCYNLGDLASNLGVGRPLARVTGWAKKVGSIKVF
jgi:hypothetical protein